MENNLVGGFDLMENVQKDWIILDLYYIEWLQLMWMNSFYSFGNYLLYVILWK